MNIKHFLQRINLASSPSVSYDYLAQLQEAFINTVPFENIDIMQGKKLRLEQDALFDKIVIRKRGGICFENNALFYWALTNLGFDVKMIFAEMFAGDTFRNHFDHMALLVQLENITYLVDVGNGKYFGTPLAIDTNTVNKSEGFSYTITSYAKDAYTLKFLDDGEWKIRYAFKTDAKVIDDYLDMCIFIETSPESAFTQKQLVTILKGNQRSTLSGNSLSVKEGGNELSVTEIATTELEQTLHKVFNISNLIKDKD